MYFLVHENSTQNIFVIGFKKRNGILDIIRETKRQWYYDRDKIIEIHLENQYIKDKIMQYRTTTFLVKIKYLSTIINI